MTVEKNTDKSSREIADQWLLADADTAWELLGILAARGSREEFELVKRLCMSRDPNRRELGTDILGFLGCGRPPFLEESLPLLIEMQADAEEAVVVSAVHALGHLEDPRAVPVLVRHAMSQSADIRSGVAFALGLTGGGSQATDALVALLEDPDTEVRDWATFGLGSQLHTNSERVRAALTRRARDVDPEVRGEAVLGLVLRGDSMSADLVRDCLAASVVSIPALEAAERLAMADFLPQLEKLKVSEACADSDFSKQLGRSIAACGAGR